MNRWWAPVIAIAAVGIVQCGGSIDKDDDGPGGAGGSVGGSGGSGGSVGGTAGSGGTSPDMFACQLNSDCQLRPASCCGMCGAATRQDSVAINKQYASQYSNDVCGPDSGCPACYSPQDPTLIASCRGGQCVVVDLLMHPVTACQSASDCRVRTTDCCECGGATDPDHLIAISVGADTQYSSMVCDPNTACPECEPVYPPVSIGCIDNHCQLVTGN